mmetsp:Transcript_30941/g.78157  ORF Transcript_30941/g.78157 Transcript_30941/m.78157 type:complete len:307 (-) Transcript_30941:55-975(-)
MCSGSVATSAARGSAPKVTPTPVTPAREAILMSTAESPTISVRPATVSASPMISSSICGCGLLLVQSAVRVARKTSPVRSSSSSKSSPRRLFPVATASVYPICFSRLRPASAPGKNVVLSAPARKCLRYPSVMMYRSQVLALGMNLLMVESTDSPMHCFIQPSSGTAGGASSRDSCSRTAWTRHSVKARRQEVVMWVMESTTVPSQSKTMSSTSRLPCWPTSSELPPTSMFTAAAATALRRRPLSVPSCAAAAAEPPARRCRRWRLGRNAVWTGKAVRRIGVLAISTGLLLMVPATAVARLREYYW